VILLIKWILILVAGIILIIIGVYFWKKGNPRDSFFKALISLIGDFIAFELPIIFAGLRSWAILLWILGFVLVVISTFSIYKNIT